MNEPFLLLSPKKYPHQPYYLFTISFNINFIWRTTFTLPLALFPSVPWRLTKKVSNLYNAQFTQKRSRLKKASTRASYSLTFLYIYFTGVAMLHKSKWMLKTGKRPKTWCTCSLWTCDSFPMWRKKIFILQPTSFFFLPPQTEGLEVRKKLYGGKTRLKISWVEKRRDEKIMIASTILYLYRKKEQTKKEW